LAPLIGFTSSHFAAPGTGWEYNRGYVPIIQAIEEAGGLPVLIPISVNRDTLRGIYDRLDGVLLPGGGDVRPSVYGQETHPATDNISDARDLLEIQLARWAVDDNMPLFGICRGHQVINVALGGTLIQDIPSQIGGKVPHNITEPRSYRAHEVEIDPSSRLAGILGGTRFQVNSLHHQSIQMAAPEVCVTAYAPDGVAEALEMPHKNFVLSVQWHPEDFYREDSAMQRLFRAFIEAASDKNSA
jgi:putative glutamine amidotransferase